MENLKLFIINSLKENSKKTLNYLKEYLLWVIVIAFWLLLIICTAVFATAFLLWDFNIVETVFTSQLFIRISIIVVLSISLAYKISCPNYFSDKFKKYKQKLEQND